MRKLLILGVAALVVFGVSAAVSFWLQKPQQPAEETESPSAPADVEPASTSKEVLPHSPFPSQYSEEAEKWESVRRTLQMKREKVDRDKKRLDERETTFKLLQKDLQKTMQAVDKKQSKLTAFMQTVQKEVAKYEEKISELDAKLSQWKALQTDQKKAEVTVTPTEEKGFKRLAEIYEKMESESAAHLIQNMADNGDTAVAVKIVSYIQPRNLAPILEKITDDQLVGRLMKRMTTLKKSKATGYGGN